MSQHEFVHLHVHTEYSLLDGLSDIGRLVERAKALEMPALAITDHGAMFGVIDFYRSARKAGVQPIVGMEGYLAPRGMRDKDSRLDKSPFHLLMLAMNNEGYRNLCRIATAAQLDGYYYKPRIDRDFLAAHSDGLIVTSGCLAAQIPSMVMEGRDDAARELLDWYLQVFGRERFFIELQQHDIPELRQVNEWLVNTGRRDDLRFVATNDVHYILREDYDAHDTLLCIQTGANKSETSRMAMSDNSYYLADREEMWRHFGHINDGEPLRNTLLIAEMCRDLSLDYKGYHLPIFPVPQGFSEADYLRYLCDKGLAWRFAERAHSEPALRERLEFELNTIIKMGFVTYFLIVWDLCEFARHADIWWNVRGSGAGSLAAYCLGITNIDPIQNHLLFERFLNPGRITMPDIDMDFPDDRRAEMIDYTVHKYGEDKVAAIITFGTLGAKAAVRDVGRAFGVDLALVNQAAGMIPTEPKPKPIPEYIDGNPDLKKLVSGDGMLQQVMQVASTLQGVSRHSSVHAAGVIVADKPLVEYIPLSRQAKDDDTLSLKQVTQFPMETCESIGLLKIDFLGLSTLTIMRRASDLIARHHDIHYTMDNIPYRSTGDAQQDAMLHEAFVLLSRGDTIGVFQVESTGMQQMLREMRPNRFENIVAAVALYRPGPMDYIPTYNARMHGLEPVHYHHDKLQTILEETYGIMVYQEQLMQIASHLFGYTLGEADLMRRAVSKKKKEDLLRHKEIFLRKGPELDASMTPEIAEKIFDDIEFFANYGFNKCVTGDTLVLDADTGAQHRIEDIASGAAVLSHTLSLDTSTQKLVRSKVCGVWNNGTKPVYRLTTRTGKTVRATGNHPFYTFGGWRQLDELVPGMHIATPRRLCAGTERADWPPHALIVLGHLLAEGNLAHTTGVYFYSGDPVIAEDYTTNLARFSNTIASVSTHKSVFSIYSKRVNRAEPSELVEWIKSLGLWGSNARTKHIPAAVFELDANSIALLLSRMWDGDGHVNGADRYAFYATASETMARQIQHLLLRLHVQSQLRRVVFPYRDGRLGWQVFITGSEALQTFSESVGLRLVSAHKRQACVELAAKAHDLTSKDIVPLDVKHIVRAEVGSRGVSWRQIYADTGVAVREFSPTSSTTKQGFRRSTIARLAEYLQSSTLESIAQSDIYWDAVVSIEYAGEEPTYDLTVDKTHNFVANDLIMHNSHAADYAVITVQSAFLKAHYPAEYMAALLTVYFDDAEKVTTFLAECKRLNIPILPPSLNRSALDFDIEPAPEGARGIRFGLAAIKNAGIGALQHLLHERASGGPFASLDELCRRVDLRLVGKRPLESLIKVGALDEFGTRPTLLNALDRIIGHSTALRRSREAGQVSLFGDAAQDSDDLLRNLPQAEEARPREILEWEKELLGIYLSSHPIDPVLEAMAGSNIASSSAIQSAGPDLQDQPVRYVGLVSGLRRTVTRNKDMMAIATLEDKFGSVNAVLFPRTWSRFQDKLTEGSVVMIGGTLDLRRGDPQIVVESVSTEFTTVTSDAAPAGQTVRAIVEDQPPGPALVIPPVAARAVAPPAGVAAPPPAFAEAYVSATSVEPPLWDDEPVAVVAPTAPAPNGHSAQAAVALPPGYDSLFDDEDAPPPVVHRITLRFVRQGDDRKDAIRLRRLIGMLRQRPGRDQFEIHIEAADQREAYAVDFDDTTMWCGPLEAELRAQAGVEIVSVDVLPPASAE